jgi:VWFA-related protein
MSRRASAFAMFLLLLLTAIPQPRLESAQAPTAATRTVLVSVVDNRGVPVAGLVPADLVVKEDGRVRPVTSLALSQVPLTVALLIDDSGPGLQSIREGAAAFVTRLRGLGTIALVTTGGRNVKVVDYTDSTASLMGAINRTYARNVTGAFLLDGIVDAAETFAKREARRPVIVSIGVEGVDFSTARPDEVFAILQRTRTQLHMARLGTPVIARSNALTAERGESMVDEMTRFNAVLGQAPPRSGGRIEQLSAHTGIPSLLAAIADDLAGQYELTYSTSNPTGSDLKLEVSTTRRGLKVRAPQRVGLPR